MRSSNIKFEKEQHDENKDGIKNYFSFVFSAGEHSVSYGYYVVYPDSVHRELVFIPEYKFRAYEERFDELSQKSFLHVTEKSNKVKPKNMKYSMTDEEINELQSLRNIITNSTTFCIKSGMTKMVLPYKYLEILQVNGDIVTLVESGDNEFMIVNPEDEWKYTVSGYYGASKPIFSRFKRAI